MTSIYNNSLTDYWNHIFIELADPRTNDWFLIKSPLPGLTILGAYLYFVLNWGPKWMQDRKPFELTNLLIVYNFLQVCMSTFLVYEAFDGLWLRPDFSFKCYPVDFTMNPNSMREARDVYIYFLAKITELLDTVFFVLRKKQSQITFLHMYHHTVMPMISWGTTKYYPGGHGTFVGAINSFVHIIMYSYYMLAAFGPKLQPYLWWKKYITVLQMFQFLLVFLHNVQLLWVPCDYPLFSLYFTLPNAGFFLYLFNDFYITSYRRSRSSQQLLAKLKEQEKQKEFKSNEKDEKVLSRTEGVEVRQRRNGHISNVVNGHANVVTNGLFNCSSSDVVKNGHTSNGGHIQANGVKYGDNNTGKGGNSYGTVRTKEVPSNNGNIIAKQQDNLVTNGTTKTRYTQPNRAVNGTKDKSVGEALNEPVKHATNSIACIAEAAELELKPEEVDIIEIATVNEVESIEVVQNSSVRQFGSDDNSPTRRDTEDKELIFSNITNGL